MSEQPAASICAGYDADGLPIGLQIVGHRFDDLGVLRVASAYERLRPELRLARAVSDHPLQQRASDLASSIGSTRVSDQSKAAQPFPMASSML